VSTRSCDNDFGKVGNSHGLFEGMESGGRGARSINRGKWRRLRADQQRDHFQAQTIRSNFELAVGLTLVSYRKRVSNMISREKNKAIVGIPLGLVLLGAAIFLSARELVPIPVRVIIALVGVGIYIWGCVALATAKGYSSAIVLTVILGVVFPAVVLLALPDKNRYYRKRRSSDS
jgi:hypothetical protein